MSKTKRIKIFRGLSSFSPPVVSFSELSNEDVSFDPSDDAAQEQAIQESLDYEKLVLTILQNLYEEEKIVFLYQLLRDYGLSIDHGSFAKTMNLSRLRYMAILSVVRQKVFLLTKARGILKTKDKNTKNTV